MVKHISCGKNMRRKLLRFDVSTFSRNEESVANFCCEVNVLSDVICDVNRWKKNRREKSDEPPLYISVHQHFLHSTWKEWSIKNLTNSIPKRLKCFSAIYPFSCIIHLEKFTFVTEKKMPKKRTAAWIF